MKMEQTVFRNVGIKNSDAGGLPRRKHTTYRTQRAKVWNQEYPATLFRKIADETRWSCLSPVCWKNALRCLNTEGDLHYIQISSSYLTENTVCFHQKGQSFKAT